jgi:alpha-N-arabinofuranosidase
VFLNAAQPATAEESAQVRAEFDPGIKLIDKSDGVYLEIALETGWSDQTARPLVTTELLGKAKIPGLPYLRPDGSPYRLDTDYLGNPRNAENPFPGPFELPAGGKQLLKVWPLAATDPAS